MACMPAGNARLYSFNAGSNISVSHAIWPPCFLSFCPPSISSSTGLFSTGSTSSATNFHHQSLSFSWYSTCANLHTFFKKVCRFACHLKARPEILSLFFLQTKDPHMVAQVQSSYPVDTGSPLWYQQHPYQHPGLVL